jgi:hypothetical protein
VRSASAPIATWLQALAPDDRHSSVVPSLGDQPHHSRIGWNSSTKR